MSFWIYDESHQEVQCMVIELKQKAKEDLGRNKTKIVNNSLIISLKNFALNHCLEL